VRVGGATEESCREMGKRGFKKCKEQVEGFLTGDGGKDRKVIAKCYKRSLRNYKTCRKVLRKPTLTVLPMPEGIIAKASEKY